jgi:transcriptional regulator with XRE-family HTH domain
MAGRRERSKVSLRELLPKLLAERGQSQRQFSEAIGFEQAYLSRVLGGQRAPSLRLLEAIAKGLGLPKDYFPEYREQAVIEAIRADADLRDKIYDSLRKSK